MNAYVKPTSSTDTESDDTAAYPLQGPDNCRSCGVSSESKVLYAVGPSAFLCVRDFIREAPLGYAKCLRCYYEKPIGLPCGEPCV